MVNHHEQDVVMVLTWSDAQQVEVAERGGDVCFTLARARYFSAPSPSRRP
jgi:hypothetical protein